MYVWEIQTQLALYMKKIFAWNVKIPSTFLFYKWRNILFNNQSHVNQDQFQIQPSQFLPIVHLLIGRDFVWSVLMDIKMTLLENVLKFQVIVIVSDIFIVGSVMNVCMDITMIDSLISVWIFIIIKKIFVSIQNSNGLTMQMEEEILYVDRRDHPIVISLIEIN